MGLAGKYNPAMTVYNPAMTAYFPPPSHLSQTDMRRKRTFPPLPTALLEEFRWSDLTINSDCKQKVLQYSLDCHTDQWLHSGSHLTIVNSNISPLQLSL
jgi:hypothetical protein